MKKIHMVTAAAGILLALAGPSLAASRAHRNVDTYTNGADAYASGASSDRSGAYYYGPAGGSRQSRASVQEQDNRNFPGYGPYPDRPYGDPDSW